MAPTRIQICTFQVGSLWCGVHLEHVQEITRYQPMTAVPLAHESVAGLINLRGRVVTVIDLRGRLGLPLRSDTEHSCNLVVRRGEGVISLLIDELGDVIEVEPDALLEPPEIGNRHAARYVEAVLETAEALLLILDVHATTALEGTP